MAYGESTGHVADDVTWPRKIYLDANISKSVRGSTGHTLCSLNIILFSSKLTNTLSFDKQVNDLYSAKAQAELGRAVNARRRSVTAQLLSLSVLTH